MLVRRKFKIIVFIDHATVPDGDPQFLKHPRKPSTEYCVIQTLRRLGFQISVIPVENSLKKLAEQLKKEKPNLVFNLTEEFKGERRKDTIITSLLSKLKIPFTGSSSIGLALCRNKILSKQILSKNKINVPDFMIFPNNRKIKIPNNIKFPLVVKPAFEDGSDGISNASRVNNIRQLQNRIKYITKKWKQPAIAEEYIKGREFYVGIIGDKNPIALPVRECIFGGEARGPCLATYSVKWDEKYRRKWKIKFVFAKLDKETTERIYKDCIKAYKLLHLRGYGRVDLRFIPLEKRHHRCLPAVKDSLSLTGLTSGGKIVILEVNANPDVARGEDLAEAARKAGISYEGFLLRIIGNAMASYGVF